MGEPCYVVQINQKSELVLFWEEQEVKMMDYIISKIGKPKEDQKSIISKIIDRDESVFKTTPNSFLKHVRIDGALNIARIFLAERKSDHQR